jgi:hypothetical protein
MGVKFLVFFDRNYFLDRCTPYNGSHSSLSRATATITEKNVYSILPCLHEMNRINRHFVYISIDTTYNRFPYVIVFVKRWFITILNANVNIYRVLLRLV